MKATVIRVAAGVIEGVVDPEGFKEARLELADGNTVLGQVELGAIAADGTVPFRSGIPATAIKDGLTLLAIREPGSTEVLASVTIIAGNPLHEDLHGQVALLRAELDLLKAAFRRSRRR